MPWSFFRSMGFASSDTHRSVDRYTLFSLSSKAEDPVHQAGEAHRIWASSRMNIKC